MSKPDILLLDEPTNHLDMESISWLETYLLNYPGAVLIVSHDRYFLDKVVTKVIEIEAGNILSYNGNYSSFALKKAQLRDAQYKAYLNQQREIKHQEAVIAKLKSFNREKSIRRAESREKMLDKIQRLDKPMEIQNQMRISLEPRFISGNDVLSVEGLSKSFPGQTLFTNISFEIKRGERVALIGNNGTGKTTMLKILNGILEADAGEFTLGSKYKLATTIRNTMCFTRRKQYSRRFPIRIPRLQKQKSETCWQHSFLQETMYLKKFPPFPAEREDAFLLQSLCFPRQIS